MYKLSELADILSKDLILADFSESTTDKKTLTGLESDFHALLLKFAMYIENLGFDERPSYSYLRKILFKMKEVVIKLQNHKDKDRSTHDI